MSDTPRTDAVDAQNKEVHSAFYEMRSHAWQLERELTEAREDCEVTSRIAEEMTKQRDNLKEELRDARLIWAKYEDRYFEAREQRDRLEGALEAIRKANRTCKCCGSIELASIIDQALEVVEGAATKDSHKFCRTTYHCGCRYNSEKP